MAEEQGSPFRDASRVLGHVLRVFLFLGFLVWFRFTGQFLAWVGERFHLESDAGSVALLAIFAGLLWLYGRFSRWAEVRFPRT